ncbi:MAG: AdoMet-dependent rRNA methyltransferase spb1 [Cirrosporium novae-zelandiae]|nr:MAG: AdoMet-dependent rRNA methyltransferase spb1 [Cirrosporium novae-zelandiae]
MGVQKKYGKGRLDKWYKLAKEKGYRARAAFKLIQLNKKYGFLQKSKVLLDLCAAPGSWCQVAAETMPVDSLIIGVDLAPIKPISRVITFQSDITSDKCRSIIRGHLKTWKADTVLHDGAPNVGTAWVQDAYSQAELVLMSLKLATEFLNKGGTFVTKVFRSKDYNALLWVFQQLFDKVEATKPPSSRAVSAEIFVVCRGFKAPKHVDPKFLDPRSVFAELPDAAPNNEAKVFNPEVKKRKRDGYEEGDYTQYKEVPVSEFIQTLDPITMLGSLNRLSFDQAPNGDIANAALERLPETTDEIKICCADLKVLGRKEFRNLLRWRLKVRERFGFSSKKAVQKEEMDGDAIEIEPMDEELRIQEELQRLNEQDSSRKKKERRKENEKKRKEIVRMQLNMTAPMDIGLEQVGPGGEDAMFAINSYEKSNLEGKSRNRMAVISEAAKHDEPSSDEDDSETDDEIDALERELDSMYDQYQTQKAESDAKYRAKKNRTYNKDDDWEGFSASEHDSDEEVEFDKSDDESSDEESSQQGTANESPVDRSTAAGKMTKRTATFFNQVVFKDLDGLADLLDEDSGVDTTSHQEVNAKSRLSKSNQKTTKDPSKAKTKTQKSLEPETKEVFKDSESEDDSFQVVHDTTSEWEADGEPRENGRLDIDIITAEAMTLAQQMASGEKSSRDLIDEGFNKYAFQDKDGLPEWFLDDEHKHSKPHRPITAAGAAAIKEKLRALNARPIKKVQEAKGRQKFRAAQRLEKLRKKSAMLADDEAMTEKDKAQAIAKLMNKAAKKKPKQHVKLVVAKGGNKGISGRPRGVKGKYKIVDARMKKDVRAEKRLAKKRK